MVCEIIWTEQVLDECEKVKDYLSAEWSLSFAEEFSNELYNRLELLKRHPEIGTPSGKYENVRRILITKHNALYYQVEKKYIILLELFDTRQDPEKNLYQ